MATSIYDRPKPAETKRLCGDVRSAADHYIAYRVGEVTFRAHPDGLNTNFERVTAMARLGRAIPSEMIRGCHGLALAIAGLDDFGPKLGLRGALGAFEPGIFIEGSLGVWEPVLRGSIARDPVFMAAFHNWRLDRVMRGEDMELAVNLMLERSTLDTRQRSSLLRTVVVEESALEGFYVGETRHDYSGVSMWTVPLAPDWFESVFAAKLAIVPTAWSIRRSATENTESWPVVGRSKSDPTKIYALEEQPDRRVIVTTKRLFRDQRGQWCCEKRSS